MTTTAVTCRKPRHSHKWRTLTAGAGLIGPARFLLECSRCLVRVTATEVER